MSKHLYTLRHLISSVSTLLAHSVHHVVAFLTSGVPGLGPAILILSILNYPGAANALFRPTCILSWLILADFHDFPFPLDSLFH